MTDAEKLATYQRMLNEWCDKADRADAALRLQPHNRKLQAEAREAREQADSIKIFIRYL